MMNRMSDMSASCRRRGANWNAAIVLLLSAALVEVKRVYNMNGFSE